MTHLYGNDVSGILAVLLFLLQTGNLEAQKICGSVTDKLTKVPLNGAAVTLAGTASGTLSDSSGHFCFAKLVPGRYSVVVSHTGYQAYVSEPLILNSVRDVDLAVELSKAAIGLDEVRITVSAHTSQPLNDFAYVSARSFTAEETDRIPASVNDPGRMAVSYPGVKPGRDESENKLIVRGNSPYGVLWRLEGIDIPSPNHFAIPGSGGAGMTAFSAQLLSRSDFFTGGMPAEYGNTISGAFDIHFREGNQHKRQYRVKAGVVGVDLSTEGGFKNGRSSYLVNYRYSTLGLLSQMGFYLAGERTTNYFQDLSFNLAFHSKNGQHTTTLFGLGGLSTEKHIPVSTPTQRDINKPDQWEDRQKPANLGVMGMTHTRNINSRSSVKYVVALIGSGIQRKFDTLNLANERYRYNTEQYNDTRLAASVTYLRHLTERTIFKTGTILNYIQYRFDKSAVPRKSDINLYQSPVRSFDGKGQTQTAQGYAQVTHQLAPGLSVNAGVHFLYLFLNHTSSPEPRLSLQYRLGKAHVFGLAYGLYGQLLPLSSYFYIKKDTINGNIRESKPNHNLALPRSRHFVLSYQYTTKSRLKLSVEIYQQQLKKVPVDANGSGYYMLNSSDGFPQTTAVSKGAGRNIGVDVGLEKFLTKSVYFLITASVFDAKYKTLTNRYYNSAFNDRFSTALTIGREFTFRNGSVLQTGARSLFNGGFRYTPADDTRSAGANQYVPLAGADYADQAPAYFRLDGRISYRTNKRKRASVLSLDIQNVTGRKNVTSMQYLPSEFTLVPKKDGTGLIPVISYQLDF